METSNKKTWLWVVIGIVILAVIGALLWIKKPVKPTPQIIPPSNMTTPPNASTSTKTLTFANLDFDSKGDINNDFSDPTGPFYHKIARALSTDGLAFTKEDDILLDKTSVPDAIRLNSGRIMLYAVDGLPKRSRSGILVAYSDNDGKTWKAGSLQVKTSRTSFIVGGDPEIVLLPDGKYRLYYINNERPAGSSPDPNAVNQVRSATSTDGLNFTEENGVRFEYANITDPDVVKIGDTWFMYLAQGPKLVAAASTDGLTFTLNKTIRDKGSVSNTIPVDGGKYRQFFCNEGIQSATSTDGLSWQNDSGTRLSPETNQFICDPVPVKLTNSWIMLYKISPAK